MGGVRRCAVLLGVCAAAPLVAGCGADEVSADRVESQLERQFGGKPEFVECDRSSDAQRFSCRLETSSNRYRYVASCPDPGEPCVIRRTGAQVR